MKKAIRIILCIFVASLFTLSCNKSDINAIAITGTWEHTKTETYKNGTLVNVTYPSSGRTRILYSFFSDGSFERGEEGTAYYEGGRWLVDGDKLILTYMRGPAETYTIEKTGLLKLVLRFDEVVDGDHYVDYLTLEHVNVPSE